IGAGDLDDVDRYAEALGRVGAPSQLGELLGESVVASLAAAGHASILFSLLPRVPSAPGSLLRGPARELARHPDWRIRWFDEPQAERADARLLDALLEVPALGVPGSPF